MSAPHLVLVVEDDPAVAEFLQLALRAMGHETEWAQDGQAALRLAAERPPQLILLDALLPKVDGFTVLREFRKTLPQVPILMMSGIYKKRSYLQEALDLGAREYLLKPLSVLKLWELAESYLGEPGPGVREPEGLAGSPLSEKPMARVLGELRGDSSTGLLFARGPQGTAILFVEDGKIVFGRSNDAQTRLDRILDRQGKLSSEAKRRARELLDRSKGRARFGDLLVEAGLLAPADLKAALAEQQVLHVTRPLTWTEGRSQFFHSEAPRHESFKLTLDMEALLIWSARHVPAGPALDAWLPPADHLLRATGELAELAERLSLAPTELELLALADGTRSVGAFRAMGRLAQVDVERLVPALRDLGLLEAVEPTGRRAGGPSGALAGAPAAGTVNSHPPARVILGTSFAGRTGALRYEGGEDGAWRRVWFDGGRIAFAQSNDPHDRLGQVLLRGGFVTTQELRSSLETAKSTPGRPLGRILVDQGILKLDDLHRALVAQVREVVAGLLRWRGGTFNFTIGPLPTQEIVPLALDPLEIVLSALRESPVSALSAQLPDGRAQVRKTWQCFELAEQIELNALEDRLLSEMDRSPNVGALLEALQADAESVLRALNLLLCLGLIEVQPVEAAAQERSSTAAPRLDELRPLDEDESFGEEGFEQVEAAPAPPAEAASDWNESFDDEQFGPAEAEGSAGQAAERFAGSGDEPALAGGSMQGLHDGPVTGAEVSFAGLMDEPDLATPAAQAPPARPHAATQDGFAELIGEPGRAGIHAGPVTGREDSFAGLADQVAAQEALERAGAEEWKLVDERSIEGLFALATTGDRTSHSGPSDGDGATTRRRATLPAAIEGNAAAGQPAPTGAAAAASAVLDLVLDPTELLLCLQTFLALLSDHLSTHPGSVPEHVLSMLPTELRERFGL